mmetsp:Transcript_29718/g.33797  ORF Transcript_29718/g.33797 Transcript_29718/m.33797 type:complete len:302 (+) Transcript_29718:30-935(+)
MDSYRVLKVPIQKNEKFFVYYKKHIPFVSMGEDEEEEEEFFNPFKEEAAKLPPGKTIFVLNLKENFNEAKLKQWFRFAGRIKSMTLGKIKKKHSTKKDIKKQGRWIYFAMIVYKTTDSVEKVMNTKWLQGQIDNMYSHVDRSKYNFQGLEFTPLATETEVDTSKTPVLDQKNAEHKAKMEEDGFTMIGEGSTVPGSWFVMASPPRTTDDALDTTPIDDPADQQDAEEDEEDGIRVVRKSHSTRKRKKRSNASNDFYKFQLRGCTSEAALDKLRKGFEKDKRELEKMRQKKRFKAEKGDSDE